MSGSLFSLCRTAIGIIFVIASVFASPVRRNTYARLQQNPNGDEVFALGNLTYLANLKYPNIVSGDCNGAANTFGALIPFTAIVTDRQVITGQYLEGIIASYLAGDDVYNEDFLEGIYLASSYAGDAVLDPSAVSFLTGVATKFLFLDTTFSAQKNNFSASFNNIFIAGLTSSAIPPGPYLASVSSNSIAFATVYLLYRDTYRDFLYGVYDTNDGNGTHSPAGIFLTHFWDPMIPVPSRIYYWNDPRPLAGKRVAVKDLFDVKGLVTSGGSQAWALITPTANTTAPSIQQIINLGGVVIGKYKLAQFASGADPWDWQDEHYPFNPRGDGWLTCSASSSGGGCSIAAYDWIDYAIGSDTGSSMRRPAAVSGTYGNRPSQGMITLERVLPLGIPTDTAGVFSRDPHKWAQFAKAWYAPTLHQDPSITGLSPLVVPDTTLYPKRILYLTDYLPLANPAAEAILQSFLGNVSQTFGMKLQRQNFTATIKAIPDPFLSNFTRLNAAISILNQYSQYELVGKPLITAWKALFDGRFPPIDSARRPGWVNFNESRISQAAYNTSLKQKALAVDWFEQNLLFSTNESCSESIMIYDIGTGGLPSFREMALNNNSASTYLAITPPGAAITGAGICPIYGCVDITIPIGQVPYRSNVTFHQEFVPVTVSVVAKRGCDFMLFNMVEKLADAGVLKTVKTGRTAF